MEIVAEVGSRNFQNYPDLRTSETAHYEIIETNGENKSIIIAGVT